MISSRAAQKGQIGDKETKAVRCFKGRLQKKKHLNPPLLCLLIYFKNPLDLDLLNNS